MRELNIAEVDAVVGGLHFAESLKDSVAGSILCAAGGTAWGATLGGSAGGNGGGVLGIGAIAQGVGMLAGGAYGLVSGAVVGAVLGFDQINTNGSIDYFMDAMTGGAISK
ncbi:hypothetical protein [Carnimonas bestiolae]|uniref:hypothetical protein n=1 Tax=Carnimonas bestiolae TaxID=3402172 RepID=UPI003EDBDC49